MPIPFRDLSDNIDLGLAGFLRFEEEPGGKGIRAALFMITSRGEPIEFSFTRIGIGRSFLWRPGEDRRHAVTALAKALFEASSNQPTLLLALADETPPRVFTEDLAVQVPLCRVGSLDATVHAATEHPELVAEMTNLFWVGRQPDPESPARLLLEALRGRQLLTEPFERAAVGLGEAYSNW